MTRTIEVVFDGKTFVPTGPVDVPLGTRLELTVELPGEPPWATVEDAIGYSRGRPGYHLFPGNAPDGGDRP